MRRFRNVPVFSVLFSVMMTASAFAGGQLFMPSLNPPIIQPEFPPVWSDADFPVPYSINAGTAAGWVEGADPASQAMERVAAGQERLIATLETQGSG